jgi:hypothetical protein
MKIRRGVWRRVGHGLLRGLIGVAAALVMLYLSSGWFLPGVVERELARQFEGAAVSVEGARLSGAGVLIKGLAISDKESSLAVSPIFIAERVHVQFAPAELLQRKVVVQAAAVRDAVLTVEYEKGRGWNVQQLGLRRGAAAAKRLPLVRIERGALRLRQVADGRLRPITTVGLNGQVAAVGGAGTYGFSFRADDRLALSGSWVEGLLQVGVAETKNSLTLTGALRMPQTWILDNAWNVDLGLDCAFDAGSVEIRRLGFQMNEGVGTLSGRVDLVADGGFDVSARLDGFKLSDMPSVNTVVYSESVMELLGPWAAKFLRRYRPQGFGDVDIQAYGRWDALPGTEVTGQIVCRDITIEDTQFPYPLEQMQGTISFSGRSLRLNQLMCRHKESAFVIDGGIDHFGPEQSIWIDVIGERVRFDEDVYRALDPEAKRLWFAFMPSGTGAIEYSYWRWPDGERSRRLAVELIDAGAIYEHFPYPLEHLTGHVVFEPDEVRLEGLEAHYSDSRRVNLNGSVSLREEGTPLVDVHLRAEQIPVDAALIKALPKAQQEFFEQLDIEATAWADVWVFPDATGRRPLDYLARLSVEGPRLEYAGFAVPLEDVRIVADVTQDVIELETLTGRCGQGQVSLSGKIFSTGNDGTGPGVCLAVEAERFELDETFWAAAEQEAKRFSSRVRLAGPVDVKGRWSRNTEAGQCSPMDIAVVCRNNSVVVGSHQTGRVSGRLQFTADRVQLDDFRIEEIALAEPLAEAMPERMRQAYRDMGLAGRVDVAIEKAELMLDEDGFGGADVTGRLTLGGLKSQATDFVDNLNGFAEGRFRLDAGGRIQEAGGLYQAGGFYVRGRPVDSLSGHFFYDPNDSVLASRDFEAAMGNGVVTGSATVDIYNEMSFLAYTLGLTFVGIDVEQIVARQGVPVESEQVQRGSAEGMIDVRGRIGRAESKEGRLSVVVSKMQLGKQTLVGKVLTAIQFREPKDYVFNRMEMVAFIRGDEVVFDRLRILGRPFVFHGDGRVNLETNHIKMDMVALGGLAGVEPMILDSLLRGLGSAFWKIEIRGDLREPEIRTISLPILQFPLDLLKR